MSSVPNLNPRISQTFSVEDLQRDYSGPEYAFAKHLGESVGSVGSGEWSEVEPLLQVIWLGGANELPWESVRVAVYRSWRSARRLAPTSSA